MYIWKTKIYSHKQYLFGYLFSRNTKTTHTDQSILTFFYNVFILREKKRLTNLKK